jgi:hypothetical protein
MPFLKKGVDCSSHQIDLLLIQLRKNRQRQAFFGCAFRSRKIALSITEMSETILLVQRERIINLSTDPGFLQLCPESIAMSRPYNKLMKNVSARSAGRSIRLYRQPKIRAQIRQRLTVFLGDLPSAVRPGTKMGQFLQENRRLQSI